MTGDALWTSLDAEAATAGRATGPAWAATGISIDSRSVRPGDLFIALQGPNFDGHDFVGDALAKGAAAAMIHRPVEGLPGDAPLLTVDDTMDGLVSLGGVARERSPALIAAVTGSVGKTGTKEALRLALEDQAPTYANVGNLNNHWGVPLSLARMPEEARYGIFELGMNHAGEIAPLSRQVKPHVAIVTTVEPVHLEHFDSVEAIADAKAEIFAGMGPTGIAILNRDNPHFARLLAHARTQGVGRIWSFGDHPDADARLTDCSLHANASAVSAVVMGEPVQYSLSAPGRHWVTNSLAVLLAVKALGADLSSGARGLARITPPKGRGARSRIRFGRDGRSGSFLLIDESYNASPASLAAALTVLGQTDLGPQGRHVAVLGDMLELGEQAAALHAGLREDLIARKVDLVFACGPLMANLYDTLPPAMRGGYAPDSAALAPLVADAVRDGDVVMVKGSLGSRMAPIVAALQALEPGGDAQNGLRTATGA
ncbi:UDP-N-acetylmuramoylalanyl-D-glutamyl-2,6-diaminopimelate--D-alanyl-D-alanine ligase [Inquilinus sp. CAU 1745]|uniref:UDP-N-acetylmuramoylalanyl-D-glutamyl-2, 6-diaminopimelate--D-alanyl-D-alanine ligase n=1 Tax=Inquilinus sp. CAU 1745 TaxID=3140369 RepID=UPI00325B67D0